MHQVILMKNDFLSENKNIIVVKLK